jgi:hypothetical protein
LITYAYKILLLFVLISFYSVYSYPKLEENFTVTFPKILRINDSVRIVVDSEVNIISDYKFNWKTNHGSIELSGKEVIYYSPDSVCMATLDLEIFNKADLISKHTFNISIFNQLIILKADDLIYDDKKIVSENWTRFLHYAISKKIKASVGLICNSLETEDGRYFGLLQYLDRTGYIELWNHGYDHRLDAQHPGGELYDEFRNSSLDFQKEQLRKAQTLGEEKLNITLRTFGAPGNAIDSTTILALQTFDEIKVWFFGLEDSDKLVLGRSAEMEYPTGKPDYNSFVQNYDPSKEYLVFQIHPNQWDEDQFDEFKKIISYLKDLQTTFILPYEYYNSISTERIN